MSRLPAHSSYKRWKSHWYAQHEALKKTADDAFVKDKVAEIERDLRYVRARLDSAILIDPATQSHETVLFGATVHVEDSEGESHTFHIVGEDEADAAANKVSWVSPLAKSLIGHKIGDTVVWQRPAGNVNLEIFGHRLPKMNVTEAIVKSSLHQGI